MPLRWLALCAAAALLASTFTVSAAPGPIHVAFRSPDGITLRGHLWAGGPRAVVFSHMFGTTQSTWFDLAGRLAAQGHTVLTYDFRGVGSSSGRLVIQHVHRDTAAAVTFVRRRRPQAVVLVGASMGGTSSIVAAGQAKVDGLVVIASGMTFQGLDARPHLPHLRMPKLFIVGSRDVPFNESAKTMHDRTPHPKELLVIPTAAHGTYMFRTAHKETIYGAILNFVNAIPR